MMKKEFEQTIYGKVPSKSNCNRVVTINGKGRIVPSKEVKLYERNFILQCKYRNRHIKGFFSFDMDAYFTTSRQDLDNSLKAIFDNLQTCGAIENDSRCVEFHARKFVDRSNPRIEFTITEMFNYDEGSSDGKTDGE